MAMTEPQPRGLRWFRILIGTAIAVIFATGALSAGWQAFAAAAREPSWMVRAWAIGWFVAVLLTGAAAAALFSARRDRP